MPRAASRVVRSQKPAPRSSSDADALTPAMRQYAEQKAQVPDALLLFRMGDFYELFYDDAVTAARVLNLTLTTRSKGENPIPLAGIPHHALNSYLARLVRAGFKVAISEQLEDPRQARGVVKRDIVRIVTPGTLTDDSLLDARTSNILAAVHGPADALAAAAAEQPGDAAIGLACIELASGRFWAECVPAARLLDELSRLRPAELILPETPIDQPHPLARTAPEGFGAAVTARPADRFDAHQAQRTLLAQFGVATLEGFGFAVFDDALCAAGAIVDYLRETQRAALQHVARIEPRASERFLGLDAAALRGLEIERTIRDGKREGSLLWAVDRTVNPMGARRLREWLCYPLRVPAEIRARQDALATLRADRARLHQIRALLRDLIDLERVLGRLGVGRATPRDAAGTAVALERAAALAALTNGADDAPTGAPPSPPDSKLRGILRDIADRLSGWSDLSAWLRTALRPDAPATARDGGFIADGFDAELDRLRAIERDGQQWLIEFQAREATATGIPSLKVAYNQVFGFYIEVTNPHRHKVPPHYVRKQTVSNAERYITDELKKHEHEVLNAEERARLREQELFDGIVRRLADELPRLQQAAAALAELDALAGLAELSSEHGYCRPQLIDDAGSPDAPAILDIRDGRHPVLDQTLGPRFVPNDCTLGGGDGTLAIITGPNMAGKSTYIRQVALLTLLAQTGSDVPAAAMRWSAADRIFARVGASDEIARGQSTFMVEMVETAAILNRATPRSLVVLDEIGRGTSTFDGLALAWAICEHLVKSSGCRTLFATHYHELTELASLLPGVANLNVAVREHRREDGREEVIFLHKIVPGATDKSYGVHVARMAGIPPSVVERSTDVLAELERGFAAESRSGPIRPRRARKEWIEPKLFDD